MTTGERIKQLRLQKGLSQEELGQMVGVKKAAINKYESGIVVNLKRSVIASLAKALDVSPAYIMGWDEETDALIEEMTSPYYQASHDAVDALIKACGSEKAIHMTRLVDGKNTLIYYRPFADTYAGAAVSCILSQIEDMNRDTIEKLYLAILAYKAADDRTRQMVDLALEPFKPAELEGWV